MSEPTTAGKDVSCNRCGAPLPVAAGGAVATCPHCGARSPGAAASLKEATDRRRALRVFTLFGRTAALMFAVPGLLMAGVAFFVLGMDGDMVPAAVRFGFPLIVAAVACTPLVLSFVFHAGVRSLVEPEDPDSPQ